MSGPPRNRRRRSRTMFDECAVSRLESVFKVDQYPDIAMRDELAAQLDVSEARIQVIIFLFRCASEFGNPRIWAL